MEAITKNRSYQPVYQEQAALGDYAAQCVQEASRIISAYWPISTFIANNGLANLENQPFDQAVDYAHRLRGAQGYLSLTEYHKFFTQGRINEADLKAAIFKTLSQLNLPGEIGIGNQAVQTEQLYHYWLFQTETPEAIKAANPTLWEVIANQLALHGFRDSAVWQSDFQVRTLGEKKKLPGGQSIIELINKQLMTWCAAFLDEGQAAWGMPDRAQGFYRAWKSLAGYDHSLRRYTKQKPASQIQALPDEAQTALVLLLQKLEIPVSAWTDYLTRHLAQLPGWASLIRWRQEHPESQTQQHHFINLVEYLAVRLFYEACLLEAAPAEVKAVKSADDTTLPEAALVARLVGVLSNLPVLVAGLSPQVLTTLTRLASECNMQTQQMIWQTAYEGHYRQELLGKLRANPLNSSSFATSVGPAAQAIFCIDVRSEGFRRHLEQQGPYETFGFAGFFGIPMLYEPLDSSAKLTIAPALLTPTQVVQEVPRRDDPAMSRRRRSLADWRITWSEIIHDLRQNLLTPFAYVEMAGWLSFFPLLGKTLWPGGWKKLQKRVQARLTPAVPTKPSIVDNPQAMSLTAQATAVAGMLRSIGLTNNFARLVFLGGHGSETDNNPYASALDCGACGGNHGGMSAFVAASVLNSASVRALLQEQGIIIPATTFFLAGEHNTTTDEVALLNEDQLPSSHQADLEQFKQALGQAGRLNAQARQAHLPGASQHLAQRAADWAQVRPEWGLVRNAAFICGRRALTANLNLDNRVFLHSYDPAQDAEGTVLEGILTAPVVVAEWINMQYYFSTVDNARFGSSTKLLHTVVGQVGVMQGRQSDLLIGLPQQSVMVGDQLYHEPLRLCVIVEAPTERISRIIAKYEQLQNLVTHQWLTLLAYDPAAQAFYQCSADLEWLEVYDKLELAA